MKYLTGTKGKRKSLIKVRVKNGKNDIKIATTHGAGWTSGGKLNKHVKQLQKSLDTEKDF